MINKYFSPFNTKVEEEETCVIDNSLQTKKQRDESAHTSIKNLSEEDRPREKLMAKGAAALTTAELLAILIGNGSTERTAVELMQDVMSACDNRLMNLSRMTMEDLMGYKGIGEAKALSIIAAAEIGRRRSEEKIQDLVQFSDGRQVLEYFIPKIQDLTHEQSWALLMNNDSRLLKCVELSSGGITETLVDVRMLFRHACMVQSTCFILVHNHPSGRLNPSKADDTLTERVKNAGKVMNIRLLDHVIVTDNDYYSYAENGKI